MAGSEKLNGTVKLNEGKRIKKVDVRFTQAEYDKVIAMEKQLGISRTVLVRMRVLDQAEKVVVNAVELIARLDSISAEMGRAGNNINQLARHANTLKLQGMLSAHIANEFNRLLADYIAIQRLLEISMRRIIQIMGK